MKIHDLSVLSPKPQPLNKNCFILSFARNKTILYMLFDLIDNLRLWTAINFLQIYWQAPREICQQRLSGIFTSLAFFMRQGIKNARQQDGNSIKSDRLILKQGKFCFHFDLICRFWWCCIKYARLIKSARINMKSARFNVFCLSTKKFCRFNGKRHVKFASTDGLAFLLVWRFSCDRALKTQDTNMAENPLKVPDRFWNRLNSDFILI